MSIVFRPDQVLQFVRRKPSPYGDAWTNAQATLDRYHISASAKRMAHFMAQVMAETGGLTREKEDLDYSVKQLQKIFTKDFAPVGLPDPRAYAGHPVALGNYVYAGKNGNTADGDGYKFRGRGLVQLTGRGNYQAVTMHLRKFHLDLPDLCDLPDTVFDPVWALEIAASFWDLHHCNSAVDNKSLRQVTKKVNGGKNGLDIRQFWLTRMQRVYRA